MSYNNDPLINASLNNVITPSNFRITDYSYYKIDQESIPIPTTQSELYNNFIDSLKSSRSSPTPDLSILLDQTTIKRACCKGDASGSFLKIKVKIPYDETYVNSLSISQNLKNQYKQFKYAEKEVLVPSLLCSTFTKPTSTSGIKASCDNFYRLYCENSKLLLEEDIGMPVYSDTFVNYSPDCGCYIDKPPDMISKQPSCYSATCNYRSKTAYIDEQTRLLGDCSSISTTMTTTPTMSRTPSDNSGLSPLSGLSGLSGLSAIQSLSPTPTTPSTQPEPKKDASSYTIYIIIAVIFVVVVIIIIIIIIVLYKKSNNTIPSVNTNKKKMLSKIKLDDD